MEQVVTSPLSIERPIWLYDLPKEFIITSLSTYFDSPCPWEAVNQDYSVWKCSETGLEFCWPLEPGNKIFYQWLSNFNSYYPSERWEYKKVISRFNTLGRSSSSILDVGCGDGSFLRLASTHGFKNVFGLDFNQDSIQKCLRFGFSAFCGSIDHAVSSGVLKKNTFDFITSFHCLEHVQNPVLFVNELFELLVQKGRLFLSTPFSPMSFEKYWFDIMNHPPHHMTRWNLRSYEKLASILNLRISFYYPRASALRQVIQIYHLLYFRFKPFKKRDFFDLLYFFKLFFDCLSSNRFHSLKGSDVILVELYR